jgi:MYXO-CTERM domain-containing protein
MKGKVTFSAAAVAALTLTGIAAGQAYQPRVHDTGVAAFPNGAAQWGPATQLGLVYGTGFESPFTPGAIHTQHGWTTFTANQLAPQISTAHPAGGAQHLRIERGPGAASSLNGAFSPNFGPNSPGRFITSVDFASNDPGGADHMIAGQSPDQGFLTWRMHFDWQNRIMVLDRLTPGGTLAFRDTGHTWNPDGQYRNVIIDFDYDADTIQYYYDNTLVWTSPAGILAATALDQVILFGDNFHTPGTGWGDWDNLVITSAPIPAPGAFALVGLAGLVCCRRRRN